MSSMGLVNRHDLAVWSKSRNAPSEFPRLVRRLILETTPKIEYLTFPAAEGVSTGGWDGIVEAPAPSAFVPAGVSGWELSVNASPTKKADDDYAKRLRDDGTATYIAVSLRPWPKRRAWAKERLAEGHWADVRAYGLDDVEMWLDSAPITHAWISNLLGKAPYGYVPAEVWAENWTAMTKPALPIDIDLAGRTDAQMALAERLAMMAGITTVRGQSIPEVMAFIIAVGHAVEESSGKHGIVSRMAFVDTLEAWRSLVAHQTPLILIPRDARLVDELPTQSHHHFIVPVSGSPADIRLPNLDSESVANILASLGVDPVRASNLGHLARRSLLAMRRQIALKPGLKQPAWGKPPVGKMVRGLAMLRYPQFLSISTVKARPPARFHPRYLAGTAA